MPGGRRDAGAIEALRVKLAAEGLFARKRPLPMLPAVIGVVTSAQGAVLHDIRTTVARRFGRPILLWPVPVQGEGRGRAHRGRDRRVQHAAARRAAAAGCADRGAGGAAASRT